MRALFFGGNLGDQQLLDLLVGESTVFYPCGPCQLAEGSERRFLRGSGYCDLFLAQVGDGQIELL